ncbi:heme-binding protein [Asticcacaulis sp. SL142]|uniref:GlcG/HbpS family heme-binding protein n=1 Tax=Asticcacaulis sp. SL142 TaxID=2995155 RepID=UPI00226CD404|nr:heme-binding protein [Asticcacaulis sp. SL142]WAC49353.1 heme-binding protein [Asticcacaulis sp. SL142]
MLSFLLAFEVAPALTLDQSIDLARSAIAACAAKGAPVSAAVVDATGTPIVILRGDGVVKPPVAAPRKAATAVKFNAAGSELEAREATDPAFAAIIKANPELYNAHGGSLPLYISGQLAGGLAVADTDHEIADECARTGLANWSAN